MRKYAKNALVLILGVITMNNIKQRLIDLLEQAYGQANNDIPSLEMIADYLIKNCIVPVVKCKDCKYCHKYKRLIDGEWEYSNCCTYLVQAEDVPDYSSTVLHTESDDECELFVSR